jgi:hypothetical protein
VTEPQEGPLKLILIYDANRNQYSITKHNQNADLAQRFVKEWNPQLVPGASLITLEQRRRHRTEDPQDCRLCREIVVHSAGIDPKPRFKRRKP